MKKKIKGKPRGNVLKHYIIPLSLLLIGLIYLIYYFGFFSAPGIAMAVSISSDGKYAITSHKNNFLVLWNLSNKTHKIISRHANNYSAYFIKNSHNFMWQSLNKTIFIQNINNRTIKSFKVHQQCYGHTITSDLKTYIYADKNWNIYLKNKKERTIKNGFGNWGKPFNLSISNNNKLLLTSGYSTDWDKQPLDHNTNIDNKNSDKQLRTSYLNGIVLYNIQTAKPIKKFVGNKGYVSAIFDAMGKYIISGDSHSNGFIWKLANKQLKFQLDDIKYGKLINEQNDRNKWRWDNNKIIKQPNDFFIVDKFFPNQIYCDHIFALKAIDNTHYLRFSTGTPYAILYDINNSQPKKYLPLGKNPLPSISLYQRSLAIDSSPISHTLVIAQENNNGIIVYKYNPQKQVLKKFYVYGK